MKEGEWAYREKMGKEGLCDEVAPESLTRCSHGHMLIRSS